MFQQKVYDRFINSEHPTTFSSPGAIARDQATNAAALEREEEGEGEVKASRKDISSTVNHAFGYTTHRDYRRPRHHQPTYVHQPLAQLQMDLIDVSPLARHNSGVTFLLVCICTWAKYAWVRPLTNKSALDVTKAVRDIIDSIEADEDILGGGKTPKSIFTDHGLVRIS